MTTQPELLFAPNPVDDICLQIEHILYDCAQGWQNAIPARDLRDLIGLKSERSLRRKIELLIDVRGIPIGSSYINPNGYFIIRPGNAQDRERGTAQRRNHALAEIVRISKILKISVRQTIAMLTDELPFP